ncbi:hypothetical protein ACGFNU_17400 [Spirillospora sp. NPDC048911]|uniref:hypothetical protein n=1 Tax=Spirillospora sp. NPDC048911 TaxID=3364527 RepID=UPI0037164D17
MEKAVRAKSGNYANVRFTTRDGRTVSAKITAWKHFPARGDRVTVCYAPDDPDSYAQDARLCPDFATPRFEAGAGLAVLAALWAPWLFSDAGPEPIGGTEQMSGMGARVRCVRAGRRHGHARSVRRHRCGVMP